MEKYFNFELTPVPTSLFKHKYVRNSDKSLLAKALLGKMKAFGEDRGHTVTTPAANRDANTIKTTLSGPAYVLDGRTVMPVTLEWKKYLDIILHYRTYALK